MKRRRLLVRIAVTLTAVALGVPILVIGAANIGLEPTHWSGTPLSRVELTRRLTNSPAAPKSANILLDAASSQDIGLFSDLAPSYWDPDSGRVMLGAATAEGVRLRERLGRSNTSGAPYQIVQLKRSWADLRRLGDLAIDNSDYRTHVGFVVDAPHDRVELIVRRLDHSTLAAMGRYDGVVAVRLSPFGNIAANQAPRPEASGSLEYVDPFGTWFTLLTGFPLYLGGVVAVLVGWWVLGVVRHRRRRQPAAPVVALTP